MCEVRWLQVVRRSISRPDSIYIVCGCAVKIYVQRSDRLSNGYGSISLDGQTFASKTWTIEASAGKGSDEDLSTQVSWLCCILRLLKAPRCLIFWSPMDKPFVFSTPTQWRTQNLWKRIDLLEFHQRLLRPPPCSSNCPCTPQPKCLPLPFDRCDRTNSRVNTISSLVPLHCLPILTWIVTKVV